MEDLGDKFMGVEEETPTKEEIELQLQGELFPLKDPETIAELLYSLCLANIFDLINGYFKLKEEIMSVREELSPALRAKYDIETLDNVLSKLSKMRERTLETQNIEDKSICVKILQDVQKESSLFMEKYNSIMREKERDYQIRTDPISGKRVVLQFKSHPTQGDPLGELRRIAQSPKPGQVRIPKDFMQLQTYSKGDTLNFVKDPKLRKNIQRLQSQGKLLSGTLEGLSGGEAYLKSFIIALAQILNEQSKYYRTDGKLSGVPRGLIPEIFGEDVKIKETDSISLPVEVKKDKGTEILQEERTFPYIIVSYEDLAGKLRGEGKQRGGKDADFIRTYIENLSGKQYLYGGIGKNGTPWVYGIKLLSKDITIYRGDRRDPDGELKEVGCLLRLSSQFSDTLRGYTGLRANTIQMIGGGRQKDITMSLLDLLLYVRGTDRDYIWKKNKEDLLSQIAKSKVYKGRPKRREEDFLEAIGKVKRCGLITSYREEKSPGGETLSVFMFNPYYSKKEEETPDVQTGE